MIRIARILLQNVLSRLNSSPVEFRTAFFLGLSFLCFYTLIRVPLLHSGDAAKFLSYAEQAEIWGIPIHVAYTFSIFLAVKALTPWGPTSLSAAQFMTAFWAACGLSALYLFCREHCKLGTIVSILAAVLLGLSSTYAFFSAVVQYASIQVACFLLALLFAGYNRPFTGGIFMAVSTLSTPASILVYPAVVVLYRSWRNATIFTLTSGLITIFLSLIEANEYYFGGRGVLSQNITVVYRKSWAEIPETFLSIVTELYNVWSIVLLFSALGLYAAFKRCPRFFVSATLLLIAHIAYNSTYFYMNRFNLPMYPILAIMAGFGIQFAWDVIQRDARVFRRVVLQTGMLIFLIYGMILLNSYTQRVLIAANKAASQALEWIEDISAIMDPEDWLYARFDEAMRRGYYVYGYAYRGNYIWNTQYPGGDITREAHQIRDYSRKGKIFVHPRAFPTLKVIGENYKIDAEFKETSKGNSYAIIAKGGFQE